MRTDWAEARLGGSVTELRREGKPAGSWGWGLNEEDAKGERVEGEERDEAEERWREIRESMASLEVLSSRETSTCERLVRDDF